MTVTQDMVLQWQQQTGWVSSKGNTLEHGAGVARVAGGVLRWQPQAA